MHTEPIKTSHPEAIALAERLTCLKHARRAAARGRWERGEVRPDDLKPATTFSLKQKDV